MRNKIYKILFTFFLLGLNYELFAQTNLPLAYEIKSDTVSEFIIDSTYWQLLADQDNNITLKQAIQASESNKFYDIQSARKVIKEPAYTYWYRFRIKNTLYTKVTIAIGSAAAKADFFFSDNGKSFKHFRTGWKYRANEKDGYKKQNIVIIEISPHTEKIVYFRRQQAEKYMPVNIQIKVSNAYQVLRNGLAEYENQYYSGEFTAKAFFAGFLILAAIFNIFFFFVVREKTYLYLSLFLITFSVSANAIVTDMLFPTSHFIFKITMRIIFISMFFLLQFVRYYFKTFEVLTKWDKIVLTVGISMCVYYGLDLIWQDDFPEPLSIISGALGVLFFIVLIITILLVRKKQNTKIRNFFMLAIAPFIVFVFIMLIILIATSIFSNSTTSEFANTPDKFQIWGEFIGYSLLAWAAVVFTWALFDRYNSQRKEMVQQAINAEKEKNELINKQKAELEIQVAERTSELKHSLDNLKSTQAQLIQSEKMASLGELTAGIAHEIQNPLNFVNNFSEVNSELVEEIKNENNIDEIKAIADDIKQNSEKILFHGKRADAIVKGMLQHSKQTSGVKEPTDINALCDEYLRLSYHGLRAKDKSFNADFKTDFDETIDKINIVPQDIGRVLLNLINNAFYATNEKKKVADNNYKPMVSVQTKKLNDKVEIRVADNGNGIPQNIIDKIFQPFFTTKPTGEGTGLGLSLSYDIITKEHHGTVKAESKEGEETTFIIQLSVS